ncbi:MAG: serine/threonine-protein kinase, partial [Gracilimonas sp.]|nr:serine/threonine-protein kinase [Gracilimonas sp.]
MDGKRWEQVEQIIDQALDLPADQRRTFIRNKAGEDTELLQAAEKFLDSIDQANRTNFLEPGSLEKQELFEELQKDKSTAAEKYIGVRVGNFTIIEILGHGGMATVFKAERSDKSIQQSVAIKILHSSLHSQESLIRFRMEQEILANLNHPNIAHFVDAGVTEDSNPYFIMEYVDGVSVLEYCTQNQLGKGQKLQLFRQLCGAIRFAHRNLVVHRDLKPNNVFVNNDGQVKVLDFSIAKLLDPGFSDQTFLQTRAGTKLLSPTYCAPEQFEMDPITTATDVYTLGLVLYEILSGRKAMDGKNKTLKEIQASICSPDFSQTLHLQENSELSAIIMKATRKEPSYRYESASQLLEDLERYEKALPLIAQRDSVSYRITKFTKRNYKAVSIVLIIIFGSLLFGNYHLQQINEQRELAELEADKATAVTDYMVDLFEQANPKKNVGDTLSVFDLLELGKNRIQNFENQPEIRLRMLNTFGDAYLA